MTEEKKCEVEVLGLIEPVFVEFGDYIMLLTPNYLIKFDHLFTKDGCRIYKNNTDMAFHLPERIKKSLIAHLDSDNSTLIHCSERKENRKFKKYVTDILEI